MNPDISDTGPDHRSKARLAGDGRSVGGIIGGGGLCAGERPPVPGAETSTFIEDIFSFQNCSSSTYLKYQDFKSNFTTLRTCPTMSTEHVADQVVDKSASLATTSKEAMNEGGREREPEGSADITPPFSESSNSNSTPPYVRWAESLRSLVSDQDGMELFAKYLKSENVYFFLEFWFACEGLRKNNAADITKLVKVINKKFMREQQVPVSEETRRNIQEKIKNKDVSRDIFDSAQAELEQRMTETVYRNFLASEEYLAYVQKMQIGESDFSTKASGSHSTASSVSGRQVQDDSGHFSVPIEVEKSRTGSTSRPGESRPGEASARPSEGAGGTTSDSTSGISESSSHHLTASVTQTAAQVVSVQPGAQPAGQLSTSSLGTQHNNTAASTIPPSTLDESDCAALIQSMSSLPTLHENSELDLSTSISKSFTQDSTRSHNNLLGLTSHSLMITQKRRHVVKPEAYAGHYLQGGPAGPRNPYHAYNSAYNPVSRQDSELQSLSSDAQTTDDNMSSFTEGSSHSYRQITSKKHIRRQLRKAHEQSLQNRENIHGVQAIVPRTQRVPPEATQPRKPSDFAAELISKLEKVKEEQDKHERLQSKLEETPSLVSQDSSRSYADYFKHNKLSFPDEPLETILDKHFSSVSHFSDKTPVLRSPGDPSGRPRSPPGYRMQAPQSINTPMGPMAPHRTLPGRGHSGVGGAGGLRGPQGSMYHQDLAYYDRDRRVGAGMVGRMDPPPPPQDNKNNFVREWVEDVERQKVVGHYDQRSQTSSSRPGQSKTSPRSGRHKTSHRTQSNDRMSTSWTGGHLPPNHYQYQKGTQMQLEEANRRLASLAHNSSLGSVGMYPGGVQSHSNNSTLRRSAGGPAKPPPGAEFTVAVYTFSQEKDPMPYRTKIYTKNVTLRNVKELLPKKGSFRFYFKTEIDGEACYEEEMEDSNQVPLWEGKVIVQCRNMD